MARTSSQGTCYLCKSTISKAAMKKHLDTCQSKGVPAATTDPTSSPSSSKSQKGKGFLLLVEGYRMPEYWMYLEAPAQATLGDLDKLLRNTWLECCGHLSAFEIAGVSYSSDAEMPSGLGTGDKSMKMKLDKALEPGMKFSHEYDFGTTTELSLKVLSEREGEAKGKSIRILARNDAPVIACQSCGKPATEVCSQCVYDGEGWLCEDCAEDHECGEEMFLPVVNSPRVGMCAYTG
jgi:Plasmid pRiA4b ORF-3-like protein